MLENFKIGHKTFYLTALLVVINTSLIVVLYSLGDFKGMTIWHWLAAFIASLTFTYIAVKYFIDYFVLRKIKLISKLISDSKEKLMISDLRKIDDMDMSDVTEEEMEWAKSRAEQIEYFTKLENYRRDFLGNISHELKTPIFSIQGYVHTLLEGGLYDEKINVKYLNRTAANIDRLQNIVEDLDAINRLESTNEPPVMVSFDIKKLVKEVIDDLELMINDNKMNISVQDGKVKDLSVWANRDNIRQVVVNLITNAIKYGKEKGDVIITFYNIGEKILIEVDDNGIGISGEDMEHIFDRFYRVDKSRNRKYGGSGLGLSIVKHLIETHGENISVRSTPDVGTTFSFTLSKGR